MKAVQARVDVTIALDAAAADAIEVNRLEALIERWIARQLVGQTIDYDAPITGRLVIAAVEVPVNAIALVETTVVAEGRVGS